MATVHLGRLVGASGFTKTVAIKCLHPQYAKDPEFVTMFIDEARLAARIQHPNVVSTLDVVALQGALFLVMEYVQGESLARLARTARAEQKTVPPDVAVSIMVGALHGLHAAHEAVSVNGTPLEIVHRDVSPQNILVGKDGAARVLDFGVAKASTRSTQTSDGIVKGKLPYMAPEQFSGIASRSTDIYAASVVLWETLVGRRLFRAQTEAATMRMILDGNVEPPSAHVAGLSPELDAIVLKGLARDPADRFATAREMARALEKCGQIATPSEVAEFVEAIAGELLSERARHVAAIEASELALDERVFASESAMISPVSDPRAQPITGSNPAAALAPLAAQLEPLTQLSTTTDSGAAERRSVAPRRRFAGTWTIAALVVLALALSGVFVLRGSSTPTSASSTSTSSANEPPATREPTPPVDREAPPPPSPAATSTQLPTPGVSVAPPPPVRPIVPPVRTTPRTPKPGKTVDCSPPYTVDAQGYRHYKRECE
jgi:serine/threonine-protein kinase